MIETAVSLQGRGWPEFAEAEVANKVILWTQRPREQAEIEHRQWFLQTLVLFQRSRLLATIWDECANPDGSQNEFDDQKIGWLEELEAVGLLRRKDGGFIWLYSRCREYLRDCFAGTASQGLSEQARSTLEKWNPRRSSPQIHRRIASWYLKTLDATGSPAAVFEAADHYCFAAEEFAADAEQAAAMLRAAEGLIRGNSFMIQTHGYSRGSCRRLETIRDRCAQIESRSTAESARKSAHDLQIICTEVMRAIAREVGEDGKAFHRLREFRALKCGRPITEAHNVKSSELEAHFGNDARSWLRWWRWCGMLAIASRSFGAADRDFARALQSLAQGEKMSITPRSEVAGIEEIDSVWLANVVENRPNDSALLVEILRIIEQCVVLLLLKDSVAERSAKNSMEQREKRFDSTRAFASLGLRLAARILACDRSADSSYVVQSVWCKSRLLMHQSILAMRLPNMRESPTIYSTAMSFLGDAETCLRVSDPRRHRADLAMVELHRAEVRLRQAGAIKISFKDSSIPFRDFCTAALDEKELEDTQQKSGLLIECRRALRTKYFGSDPQAIALSDEIRQIKSLAADALRFLDRAEPVLRDRRKNVWWTTWFFERRLRAISVMLWSSVLESGSPIPFLGLEASMRKTATQADLLLEDGVRMIRVDEYRLATIIEAYASCARALQLRLLWDDKCLPLPERMKRMKDSLSTALEELERVRERREKAVEMLVNQVSNPKAKEDAALDAGVRGYVQSVKTRCAEVAKRL